VQHVLTGKPVQVFVGEQFATRFAVLTGGVLFVLVAQYQHVQGHLVGLLQITVATHVDLSIRQVASIYFKNVTARDWMPREPGKRGCLPGPAWDEL
jgi:ABC-type xylose transport system permease subunit